MIMLILVIGLEISLFWNYFGTHVIKADLNKGCSLSPANWFIIIIIKNIYIELLLKGKLAHNLNDNSFLGN